MMNALIKALILPAILYFLAQLFVYLGIFNVFPSVDVPLHFFGGFSIAFGGWIVVRYLQSQKKIPILPFFFSIIFLVSLTALFAVLWEFYEFLYDYFFGFSTQLGVADTVADLMIGSLGGLFGALLSVKRKK